MKLSTQTLQNFRVQKYDAKFKWTEHPYKLMFISGTKVSPIETIPDMPLCGFKFKKITEIISGNFREDLLVGSLNYFVNADVIGVVHELGSPQTTMGGKLKFPFTIKDLSANVIDCCLWDSLAAHFIDYLKIRTDS
ncbi:replication protein A1-like protein, partial [Trifolium medium]|nr:replication protein A1-like protein [Trifolium medium]